MRKSTRTIAWIFYIISVLTLIYGFLFLQHKYLIFSYYAMLLLIPWIICIVDSIKSKKNANGLWVIFLIFGGLVAIPLWLIYHGKDSDSIIKPAKIENNE